MVPVEVLELEPELEPERLLALELVLWVSVTLSSLPLVLEPLPSL